MTASTSRLTLACSATQAGTATGMGKGMGSGGGKDDGWGRLLGGAQRLLGKKRLAARGPQNGHLLIIGIQHNLLMKFKLSSNLAIAH